MSEKRKDKRGRILKDGESQRSDGRYMYRYTDSDGERKTVYSWLLFSTDKLPDGKKPCTALRDLEDEIKRNALLGIEKKKTVTIDSMFDKYISMKKGIKQTTLTTYMYSYNKHVRGKFGEKDISKVKYSDIKTFYLDLHYSTGLNMRTIRVVNSLLEPTFKMAVRDGLIKVNPCIDVMAEVKADIGGDPGMRHGLTLPQQQVFLNYINNMPDIHARNILITLLGTGCRIGEIVGLCWQDCDFENNEITIQRTMCRYKIYGDEVSEFHVSTPKSKAGNRTVPMFAEVKEALLSEKSLGRVCREVDGVSGFVFVTTTGEPVCANNLDCTINRIVNRCNFREEVKAEMEGREPVLLPRMSAHTLRHTFCTRMCENETNVKVIQNVMGHSTISVTMDVYTDVTQQKRRDVFENLEGKLGLAL